MGDLVMLVVAGVAGLALGLFYFGGLWLTMRSLPESRFPAALTLGSYLVRTVATLAGFFLIMADRWERMLTCLAGFVIMRFVVVAWLRPEDAPPSTPRPKIEEDQP